MLKKKPHLLLIIFLALVGMLIGIAAIVSNKDKNNDTTSDSLVVEIPEKSIDDTIESTIEMEVVEIEEAIEECTIDHTPEIPDEPIIDEPIVEEPVAEEVAETPSSDNYSANNSMLDASDDPSFTPYDYSEGDYTYKSFGSGVIISFDGEKTVYTDMSCSSINSSFVGGGISMTGDLALRQCYETGMIEVRDGYGTRGWITPDGVKTGW